MQHRSWFLVQILLLCAFLVACSGGVSSVTPGLTSGAAHSGSNSPGSGHVCWGFWDISIDPATRSADVVPLRIATFNANVTMFLQKPIAPINLLKVAINPASNFATGYIDCDVTLEHPFKSLPMYRGFDVRGIFMADGSLPVEATPGLVRAAVYEARVLNADGYTRWWNASEFGPEGTIFGFIRGKAGFPYQPSATVNPYKYFSDALDKTAGVETLDPSTRGTFSTTPGLNTRNYIIQFPATGGAPDLRFQYAIDASWDSPDPSYAPDYPIEAFNANAQMREPYHIMVSDEGSTAFYEGPSEKGGQLHLAIEVFDWQTPPTGPSSEIAALFVESPLVGGVVNVLPTATQLAGSQPTSRVYSVVLTDLTPMHAGAEEIFISAQSSVGTYAPNIDDIGPNWIYPDTPLTAYSLGSVTVMGSNPNQPPIAIADKTNPLTGFSPLKVHMDPTGSYDPDQATGDYIAKYEWDIGADGTYEYSNTNGAIVDHIFTQPGDYLIQLRVTDSWGATGTLAQPIEVQVTQGEDMWPMGFYDIGNTCYNPNSNVAPPLKLVWTATHPGICLTNFIAGRGHLYIVDGSGGNLACVSDVDGSLIWTKPIKTGGSFWVGCSPALWNDHIIMGGTGVHSFNADTGALDWYVFDGVSFDHQGMVLAEDTIFIRSTSSTYRSLDPVDGSENWETGWSVYPLMTTAYGKVGNQGYCVAPYNYSERCVRADNGADVWQQNCGTDAYGNVIVLGEYAYFGGATLYKSHLATGGVAASYALSNYQPLGMCTNSDTIFFLVRMTYSPYSEKLIAFDFDLNFKWEQPVQYNSEHPVYSGGFVWLTNGAVSNDERLTAFDAVDGSIDYVDSVTLNPGNPIWSGAVNVKNRLYVVNNQGKVFCFEHQD